VMEIAINVRRVILATSMESAVNINAIRKATTWIASETMKNSYVVLNCSPELNNTYDFTEMIRTRLVRQFRNINIIKDIK